MARRLVRRQRLRIGREVVFGPLRARERPFLLGTQRKFFAGRSDVQCNARLLVPAGVLTLEEMAEEAPLQLGAVIAVEMCEVRIAVPLQPFLLRGARKPAFDVPAQMQADAAPVADGKTRP